MARKASDADVEHAVNAYVAGESIEDAARRFHTAAERLRGVLIARDLFRSPEERRAVRSVKSSAALRAKRELPVEEIVRRYQAGESENQLALAFGASRSVIAARLRAMNVPRRNNRVANQLMMAQRSPEEHRRNVAAAHDAVRGRKQTREHRSKIARTRQVVHGAISPAEMLLQLWLRDRGVETVAQQAIGPYNVDLGAEPVAVEVLGGSWHAYGRHALRAPARTNDILDQGWNLIFVWVDVAKWPFAEACADEVVAFVQQSRRDPAFRHQYRVIRSDGQPMPEGSIYFHDGPGIPALGSTDHPGA